MTSNEVAKDNRLGYLVPINSWTSNLKVANPSSICVFMFGGCGGLVFSFLGLLVCNFHFLWVPS
jgi:hypothetical protein